MKVHTTAVVLIPPEDVWEPIQRIRHYHDSKIDRWMPHFTLLYPFLPVEKFAEASAIFSSAVAGLSPFTMTLSELGRFSHGRSNFTFWLGPREKAPIVNLQRALFEAMPECDDQNRDGKSFTPHLTVARGRGQKAGVDLFEELNAIWEPITFQVEQIAMIARAGDGPFTIETVLELATRESLSSS
ncbi:MAG: 2'-5' RNA ligase family protein [Planctomycetota bacterium]|nr:2'-5' RNA ligase family protein [Planctomycetota bacterium]